MPSGGSLPLRQMTAATSAQNDFSGYAVNIAIYAAGGSQVLEVAVVQADTQGIFSYTVSGEYDSGSYYASITPMDAHGNYSGETRAIPFEVQIVDCESLTNLIAQPNPATNVCPATTADTTISGAIDGFNIDRL